MRRILTLVAALVVLLLATGLAACGGGDDSGSTAAEAGGQGQTESGASTTGDKKSGSAEGKSGSGGNGGSGGEGQAGGSAGSDGFTPKHHEDSGGGSQQYRVKGGDNSVQEFGEEADTSERAAAATALHNFLDARAQGNWEATCDYMSKSVIESFERLIAQTKQVEANSCGEILEQLINPAAKQSLQDEAAQADVGSLRIEGGQAFVIYTAAGAIYAMPMTSEGGAWKVASLSGTPLS